ncbi:MAG: PIN domain-containing protein [Ignavibacteriae bacterium]|nr:PIN domain-containing protein [Ignavibacteriota bacterium]NOG98977.1 PIN domain-containing protein [Ignavibacteriota bacterium]
MRVLFDGSVIIAAIIEAHPKHEMAIEWLLKAKTKKFKLVISSHSLLEVYSVLTAAPFKPKISPSTARKLVDANIKKIASVHSINGNEYFRLIDKVSNLNLKGGIVYDALIYECARKAKAKEIVTLNAKDFKRLNINNEIKITSF